ncbi:unnamed protein product [Lathyrus sativus]|nr:unnamed protein product [Lathyrus sativus]
MRGYHPSCEAMITSTWSIRVLGFRMYVLNRKLQLLKSNLKFWEKKAFGNVKDNVDMAESKLKDIPKPNRLYRPFRPTCKPRKKCTM